MRHLITTFFFTLAATITATGQDLPPTPPAKTSLAADSVRSLGDQPQRALLLAVEGLRRSPSLQTQVAELRSALRTALAEFSGVGLPGHEGMVRAVAIDAEARWLATGDGSGRLQLWDLSAADPAAAPTRQLELGEGITTLAIGPKSRWLAVADWSGLVRLWDLEDGSTAPLHQLEVGRSAVQTLHFSNRGDTLWMAGSDSLADWSFTAARPQPRFFPLGVEGSPRHLHRILIAEKTGRAVLVRQDGSLAVLDRDDSGWRRTASMHLGPEQASADVYALSPDGRWLLSGGPVPELWDLERSTSRALGTIRFRPSSACFDPRSTKLALGGTDGRIRIWSTGEPAESPVIVAGHTGWVLALSFSPDGARLASGSNDRTVRLWDLSPLRHKTRGQVLRGHDSGVTAFRFSPDGRWLAAGTARQAPRLWNLSHLDAEPRVLDDGTRNLVATFTRDGRWLATGGFHGRTRLWWLDRPENSARPTELRLVPLADSAVIRISSSPTDRWLITQTADLSLLLWDLDSDRTTVTAVTLRGVREFAVDPAERWLIFTDLAGNVAAYELSSTPSVRLITTSGTPGTSILFTRNGNHLITGDSRSLRVWKVQRGRTPDPFTLHAAGGPPLTSDAILSPDGEWLAVGCGPNAKCLYQVDRSMSTFQGPTVLQGHQSLVMSMTFTADSRWLVTASNDKTARLWSLPTDGRSADFVLRGHEAQLLKIATSPDGHWLATTAFDAAPRLWDLSAPDPSSTGIPLPGHGLQPIFSESRGLLGFYDVAFSTDGKRLATIGLDGIVRLWRLDEDEILDLACRFAGRNLTMEEWRTFVDPTAPYECTCPRLPPGSGGREECSTLIE